MSDTHADFPTVKIMADLSLATLKSRKDFPAITEELCNTGIRYRWGSFTKLLITKNCGIKFIPTHLKMALNSTGNGVYSLNPR
ncbi:Hypothetical predicted protein [Pelobates cultripes]|uniref:Uncharacterized protein n=1 Tax=Pelobates cultripes TaxID=61616 RepID=A0AAD1SCM7_PELCU|nr:Hypothetical predicted protein [Pelobates cultripes]